jgi:hypothetical protein
MRGRPLKNQASLVENGIHLFKRVKRKKEMEEYTGAPIVP